jgi:hypothetical protein
MARRRKLAGTLQLNYSKMHDSASKPEWNFAMQLFGSRHSDGTFLHVVEGRIAATFVLHNAAHRT